MNASIKKFVIFLVLLMSFITSAAYDIKVDGIYYNVTVGDNPICEVTYGEELYSGFINVPMEDMSMQPEAMHSLLESPVSTYDW